MYDLPKGTVTFLFTDIAESTHPQQQLGDRYADVLGQCRQLLRAALSVWNGHEVDIQGDAFFVAFARAIDAVSAAVDMQRALAAHVWPNGVIVRVRMGLHTGEPGLGPEGYIGLDLVRGARIMSAGHGGQTVLSQTTRDLVEHNLPGGVSLQDLGAHRLKDLQHLSHLFQLVIAGLPTAFPPLKTLDLYPNNLPIQPTALIGREKEVAAVERLLGREDVRLVTLTGPGGIGKTRLGLQVAAELADRFPDGVYFVNLAPISDPEFVVPTIAQVLAVKEIAGQALLDELKTWLWEKQLLLLLDNFEQMVSAAGQVFERVASLIDKSMLQQTEEQGEEPRLLMLETIRAYGQACLKASGEEEVTRQAHAAYYLWLSETAEQEIEGPQQAVWLEQLEQEHDNLRTALSWWIEQEETGQSTGEGWGKALRLGVALEQFWMIRGHYSEGRTFLERALAGREGVASAMQAKALGAAAWLAINQGDTDRGEVLCEESLSLWQELGDTTGIALSLQRLAVVAWVKNNPAGARSLMEEALARWKAVGDKRHIGWVLTWLAYMAAQQGEYARALALCEESLVLYREIEIKIGIAGSLGRLTEVLYLSQSDPARVRALLKEALALSREVGDKLGMAHGQRFAGQLALSQGDTTTARPLIEEALALFREIGNREGMALSLALLARIEEVQGDHAAARALYEESVTMASQGMSDKGALASCLEGLASLVVAQGELVRAARFWGAAERLRETIGAPIPPVERADYGRAVASARAQLGEEAFAAAWAEGRTMSPEQALAAQGQVALPTPGERSSSPTPAPPPTYPDGLTTREVEVLRVVAQGLTNEQVAERLVISPRTVDTHLTSIYSKIGVSSRSAATRYAIEHHLVRPPLRDSP